MKIRDVLILSAFFVALSGVFAAGLLVGRGMQAGDDRQDKDVTVRLGWQAADGWADCKIQKKYLMMLVRSCYGTELPETDGENATR